MFEMRFIEILLQSWLSGPRRGLVPGEAVVWRGYLNKSREIAGNSVQSRGKVEDA
jgi:hypothetical protein